MRLGSSTFFAFCATGCLVTGIAAAQFSARAATEHAQAYNEFATGALHEGAVRLIELLRDTPGDDASHADTLVGPSQLLGFAIASLMTWPDRTRLLTEVLNPDEYPTDKLLIATMQAGSGIQSMALPARKTLEDLAKTGHLAVRVTALYFLGEPYYYRGAASQKPSVAELVLAYPNLEFSRHLIEMPVYYTLDKAAQSADSDKYLLEGVIYWGGRKELVLQASPGLAKAAEALPSMNFRDIDEAVVGRWSDGLVSEKDPKIRYTVVSLLAKTCGTPERRDKARAGLEALAALPPATPDVLRARLLLADFARAGHDPKTLLSLVQGLLRLNVLPCTAERSMYEAVMQTAQHASRYFTLFGHHTMAIQTHDALAAKFPDTALAEAEYKKADAIRADALQASLDAIAMEIDAPLRNRNMEALQERYLDIIKHTPHDSLRMILIDQLRNAGRKMDEVAQEMGF